MRVVLGICLIALAQAQEGQQGNPKLPEVYSSITVTGKQEEPSLERRTSEAFSKTLFSRDDQVFHVLDGGINAGQHEGGGKSLEIHVRVSRPMACDAPAW